MFAQVVTYHATSTVVQPISQPKLPSWNTSLDISNTLPVVFVPLAKLGSLIINHETPTPTSAHTLIVSSLLSIFVF